MSNVERMSIALTKELASLVRDAVDSGSYTSSSEVIREALRNWEIKRAIELREMQELHKAIQAGMDDVRAGRVTKIDDADSFLNDVKKRGRERLAKDN